MLTRDLIPQPHIWQLVLEIGTDTLGVVAFSPFEDHALIHSEIPLDPQAASPLTALENAVYDNPMLLLDFKHVTVVYDTLRFMAVDRPEPEADDMALFRQAYPELPDEASEILTSEVPAASASIVYDIPTALLGFLRRTFVGMSLTLPVAAQAQWMAMKYPGRRSGKTLVNVRPRRVDLVILGDAAPLAMVSHEIREATDAAYYVMATRQLHQVGESEEILIAGTPELRSATSELLRRYVRYVMPAIFPSVMFRAGKASLSAPLEMILAPIAYGSASDARPATRSEQTN